MGESRKGMGRGKEEKVGEKENSKIKKGRMRSGRGEIQ